MRQSMDHGTGYGDGNSKGMEIDSNYSACAQVLATSTRVLTCTLARSHNLLASRVRASVKLPMSCTVLLSYRLFV